MFPNIKLECMEYHIMKLWAFQFLYWNHTCLIESSNKLSEAENKYYTYKWLWWTRDETCFKTRDLKLYGCNVNWRTRACSQKVPTTSQVVGACLAAGLFFIQKCIVVHSNIFSILVTVVCPTAFSCAPSPENAIVDFSSSAVKIPLEEERGGGGFGDDVFSSPYGKEEKKDKK